MRFTGTNRLAKGVHAGGRADGAARKKNRAPDHGHDKCKRTIADVRLPDDTNVNHALVKDGWCCWYRKAAPRVTVLEGLETKVREARKGLWIDPQPVPLL